TFVTWARYFFTDEYSYEERAVSKWLSKPEVADVLAALAATYERLEVWHAEAIETATRVLADSRGIKAAEVIHPCRAAVTGTTIGPSLFHILELLSREDVVNRLRRTEVLVRSGEITKLVVAQAPADSA
ncbi:MAG: hypothetical protein N2512_01345, partial [Armatimonadetes bacterium]|nr:hypothetical protein [Armatimonadota bacterium]